MSETETVTDPVPKESEIAGAGAGGGAGVAVARGAGARVGEDAGAGCVGGELAWSAERFATCAWPHPDTARRTAHPTVNRTLSTIFLQR
jgi:hypothetical protein